MPSFDIVNKIDTQEVDNAVNNSTKEIATRYDLRGTGTEITFDKKEKTLEIIAADGMKLDAVKEILLGNSVKRKVDLKSFQFQEPRPTSNGRLRLKIEIREGVDTDVGRKIVRLIKDQKLKVQASMMDDQVRVTGKKIDDLQEVIQLLKKADLEIPLQYVNMKS